MPKITVLQVVESMNMGGIQNFIMNVYRKIDRENIQFDFITHKDGVFDDEIRSLGGKIYKLDYISKVGPFKFQKQYEEFFKAHPEYKTIHVHLNEVSGAVLKVAKKCNIPNRIVHSHNISNSSNFTTKLIKKFLKTKINKNATLRLSCSDEAGKWLYKNKKYEIIPNGIEFNKFMYNEKNRDEIRKKYNITGKTNVIGCVASFKEQKNHMFLIDIFEKYLEKVPDSVLLLVGEGSLKKKLSKKIKSKDLQDKVIFAGQNIDIEKYYSAFDFFVLPSLYEGLGIVYIEAQVSGLKTYAPSKRVPKFAKISKRLEWIPLEYGAEYWADQIGTKRNYKRENIKFNNDIYDINNVVHNMENIYGRNE